jgi:hypothetical protein
MATSYISIEVNSDVAQAFTAASPAERRKLQLLLSLRLLELTSAPSRSLSAIMDEAAARAKAQGLTPAILESLLHEE